MAGYIHLGDKIADLLEEQHKTKAQLAIELGMSQGNAGHLTKRENIDVQMVHRLGNNLKYNFWKHYPIDDGKGNTAEAENGRLKQLNEEKEKELNELKASIGELQKQLSEKQKQLSERDKLLEDGQREMELLKQENKFLKEINELLKRK